MPNDIIKVYAYPGIPGAAAGLPSGTQGDVLYHNGTAFVVLNAGTNGLVLRTNGAGANPSWSSTATFSTISEATTGAGVTIDGVVLKDGGATLTGGLTGTTATFTGALTCGDNIAMDGGDITGVQDIDAATVTCATVIERSAGAGVTIDGFKAKDGGFICADGSTGEVDTINEATTGAGVTVDGVLLKDNDVEVGTSGEVRTDTISEKTSANGVDIDGVNLKDGGATLTAGLTGTTATLSGAASAASLTTSGNITVGGALKGVLSEDYIRVDAEHANATDTRTGLSAYDENYPFVTIQAAVNAASTNDKVVIYSTDSSETTTVEIPDVSLHVMYFGRRANLPVAGFETSYSITKSLYLYNIKLNKSGPLIQQSGTAGSVYLYDCEFVSLVGAAFTQADSSQFLYLYRSQLDSVATCTVNGSLVIGDYSHCSGTMSGSGTTYIYDGSSYDAVSTSTITKWNASPGHGGATYFNELETDTISESTSANGVDIDGTNLKDGGITFAYEKSPVTSKTSSFTASALENDYECDATSAAITATLPAASSCSGLVLHFTKIDASANNVILDGNASETINGASTYTISSQWESVTIKSNGTSWSAR